MTRFFYRFISLLKFILIFIVSLFLSLAPAVFSVQADSIDRDIAKAGKADVSSDQQRVKKHRQEIETLTFKIKQLAKDNHSDKIFLKRLCAQRMSMIEQLVQVDPQEAVTVLLDPAEISKLPEFVKDEFEENIQTEGQLEVYIVEEIELGQGKIFYNLIKDNSRLQLHFTRGEPRLISGEKLHVKGLKIRNHIAVTSWEPKNDK